MSTELSKLTETEKTRFIDAVARMMLIEANPGVTINLSVNTAWDKARDFFESRTEGHENTVHHFLKDFAKRANGDQLRWPQGDPNLLQYVELLRK
jgi:hypothetical protein